MLRYGLVPSVALFPKMYRGQICNLVYIYICNSLVVWKASGFRALNVTRILRICGQILIERVDVTYMDPEATYIWNVILVDSDLHSGIRGPP